MPNERRSECCSPGNLKRKYAELRNTMKGMYVVRRICSIAIFFLTMLLMKEFMDSVLPVPPESPGRGVRGNKGHHVRPDAILDVEAVAEEEQMGPDVLDGGELQEEVDAMEGDTVQSEEMEEEEDVDEKVVDEPNGAAVEREEDENEEVEETKEVEPQPSQKPEEDLFEAAPKDGGYDEPEDAALVTQPPPPPPQAQETSPPSSPLLSSSKKSKKSENSKEAKQPPSSAFGPNYYTVVIDRNTKMESVQILLKEEVFKFQVKACSDAYLLYKQTKAADEFSYHIGLGFGRKTVIWKQPPDPVTKEFMTPGEGLLKCEEFVSYWVRWEGAKFGIGLDGAQPFVEWKDPKPFTIGAVSLATPHPKQKVTWKLDTQSIGTLRVDTGEDYSYEQSWVSAIGRSAIVLQVKACRDVHVLLSDKEGVPGNGYEVAIGMSDNMKTAIREVKFGPNMINVDTPDILSCKDTRAFWFRWSHHKLSMGRGTKLGNRTLINYGKEDHPMEIRSLGLSTGWGATGRWLFNMAETVMYPS